MTTPAARHAASADGASGSGGRRFGGRVAIAALGLTVAAALIATDDQDPLVFAIPVLVLTTVLITVITIAGRDDDAEWMRDAARETGLDYDGIRPLPALTPILRDVRAPAPMMSGDLEDADGPAVRVARTRDRLVALVETDAAKLDADARARLDSHPLRAEAAIEDGLLVVAVGREASPRELLELTRALSGGR